MISKPVSNFPWTPEGLVLLNAINLIIKNNGGIERMHEIIHNEVNGALRTIENKKIRDNIKNIIKYGISVRDAAELMDLPEYTVSKYLSKHRILNNLSK